MTDTATDDLMLDEGWLAAPAKRSRVRAALVAVLAAALCFLGGALVQKHFGTDSGADAASPTGFGGGQLPAGLPEGGFPGGSGQLPGAEGVTGDAQAGADDVESVIGEVVAVRGSVWTVEDLGGERHKIQVGEDTDVVRETRLDPTGVKVGDSVDISGTTSDGQFQADEVTLR